MSEAVLKLLPQVQALTSEEWLELCERMDESKEGELTTEEADAAWLPVLERRRQELLSGEVKGVTIEEMFAKMDARRAARAAKK